MSKASKQSKTKAPGVVSDTAGMVKAAKAEKPAKAKAPAKPAGQAKPSIFSRIARYFSDVRAEMKRVVWPNRTEVFNASGIVITTLVIFVIMIAVFDWVSLTLVRALQGIGG